VTVTFCGVGVVAVAEGGGVVDEVEVAVVVVVGVGDGVGLLELLHAVVSVALAPIVSAAIAATPPKMRWVLLIMMDLDCCG
jgi:hypothetical protein